VIELAGGNDGLNTFIPYTDATYGKLRPSLGIHNGIPVSSTVALHPALTDWQPLLEAGRLAIIQNVGYPNPDLSHFRSKEVWQSGSVQPSPDSGWLARYLDSAQAATSDGIFLGEDYPLALTGATNRYLHLAPSLVVNTRGSLGQAIQQLYAHPQPHPLAEQVRLTVLQSTRAVADLQQDLEQRGATQGYPQGPFGQGLALISRLVDSGAQVIYLTLGGWDTHTNQAGRHERLLTLIGQGLAALDRDLQARGLDQQVLTLLQSEFGRRPAENGSGGTDHGTAGPMVVMGSVRGGFYGGDPALDSLVKGNLPVQVDFRQVYSELLSGWWAADPKEILENSFQPLGILA
jgi:uncharacterized protein (DUF1501 family)